MKWKSDKPKIETLLVIICIGVIIANFLPYFILGEHFPVTIHDNLDSNVIWTKLIIENNHFFSYKENTVPQVMNANIQLSYSGDISFLFFKVFGMYWGYVVNKIVMAIVAFFGMYLLLKKHIIPGKHNIFIHYLLALTYCILPFWSFTLSVAGLPVTLYAVLNIRRRHIEWYNWVILVIFAFYSSLLLTGFFFLVVISFIWLIDFFKYKKANPYFFTSIVLLSISYTISHFPLIYSFLFPSVDVSHRVEFVKDKVSFLQAFNSSIDILFNGQYHAHSLHKWMLPAIVFSLPLIRKEWKNNPKLFLILLFLLASSFFYGFINWGKIGVLITGINEVLPIQFQRFHFLQPLCWFIVFGIALSIIKNRFKFGGVVAVFFIIIEFSFVAIHHEYILNKNMPGYASFYSEDLFTEVKKSIGQDTSEYRVINVGLHPAVAQYNGFYTLDAYIPTYPLSYKHQFRRVIEPELNKSDELKKYFDNWGSRCYAFSSELDKKFLFSKKDQKEINSLDYDFEELKKMGGKYIISAVKINVKNKKNLTFKGVFSTDSSYWKIFLYEIKI